MVNGIKHYNNFLWLNISKSIGNISTGQVNGKIIDFLRCKSAAGLPHSHHFHQVSWLCSIAFPYQVAMLICAGFLIAWIPYAVVSVWSAFGRPDSIPIQLSVVPTLLAKSAAMYNPIIYQVIDYKFACCQTGRLKATKKKSLEDFR